MATTTADDVSVAGTDYRYQLIADSFIASSTTQRDSAVQLGIDTRGSLAASFTRMSLEGERFGSTMSIATGMMVGNMITNMQAVGADDAIALVKMGMGLSNSATPPTPSYQNTGTAGPGQGFNLHLPSGTTKTTT